MSIEDTNIDLNGATGHLQTAQEAASNVENIAQATWGTVGRLITEPNSLYLFDSLSNRANRMVVPADITTTVDASATGYSEAFGELAETTRGIDNDHINNALAHLHSALDLLREGDTNATTQAKIIEGNVQKLGEGVLTIVELLHDMNEAAWRLKINAKESVRHDKISLRAIEDYRKTI